MYLNIRKVESEGFMSFADCEYSLDSLGIAKISGINKFETKSESNGSGKSALIEMILWNLTGHTSRGSKEVANSKLGIGTKVTIYFSIDEDDYIVTRSLRHKDLGSSLTIIKNGKDISGNTVTKSNNILASELRGDIDYELLTSVMILSQGLPSRLSNLSPASRKSKLEDLSKLTDLVDSVMSQCKDSIKDINNRLSEVKVEISSKEGSIAEASRTLNRCKFEIEDLKSKSDSILTDSELDKLNKSKDELLSKVKEHTEKYTKLDSQSRELYKLITEINSEINMNNSFIKSNLQKIDELRNPKSNICPMCGQEIKSDNSQEHINLSIETLEESNKNLQDSIDKSKDSIDVLESKYIKKNQAISEVRVDIDKFNKDIKDIDLRISEHNYATRSIDKLIEDSNQLEKSIELYTEEITKLYKSEESIANELTIAEYFKYRMSRDIRTFLLSNVVASINKKCAEYSPYLFKDQGVVRLDESNLDIYLGDREFKSLSGGEGRRVDIILQLAQRDLCRVESNISSNILVLDEVLDNLDSLGIESVIELLNYKSPDINSMLIISHKNDIELPYDSEITVVKGTNEISYIQ